MRRFLIVLVWLIAVPCHADVRPITIIHTNDFHGHLEPFVDKALATPPVLVGGAAYLAGQIETLRRDHPDALLLDGGDIAQGTPISNLFFGRPVVDMMNMLHYDARTIGNHEFDWGLDKLQAMIDGTHGAVVCANLVLKHGGSLLPHVRPYIVRHVNGVTVGILGLITPDTPKLSFPDHVAAVQFLNPEATVRRYLPQMRKDGVQMVVLLTHLGWEEDVRLAQSVPGIDVIVGGHSHTPLHDPKMSGHTVIVQAGCFSRYVGLLQVDYDTALHQVVSHTEHQELTTVLTSTGHADEKVAAMVARYKAQVADVINQPIGSLVDDLPLAGSSTGDTPIGDVLTDAMREESGADVAMYNYGGIRGTLMAGPVKWADVYTVLPFEDHVVTVGLTGQQLLTLMQEGLKAEDIRHLPQVSGLSFGIDEKTHTLEDVQVGGIPLDPSKTYTVVSVDFLYLGGDGIKVLHQGTPPRYGRLARDVLADYLRHHPALKAPPGGRVRVLSPAAP